MSGSTTEMTQAFAAMLPRVTDKQPRPTCTCWADTEKAMEERGFKIARSCTAFSIHELTLKMRRYLPLERLDGKRLRASDPKGVAFTHCPWCGIKLPE